MCRRTAHGAPSYTVSKTFNAGTTYYLWLTANKKTKYSLLKHANSYDMSAEVPYVPPVVTDKTVRIRHNGSYAQYLPKLRRNGAWTSYEPKIYHNGQWRDYGG